jgi:hypothetical protein
MRVTSIRFERELIDKLKTLAGKRGYQSLVRDVLWDYVRQHSDDPGFHILRQQIRAIMAAEALCRERCALTGVIIEPEEEMWMAFTTDHKLIPLSIDSLVEDLD